MNLVYFNDFPPGVCVVVPPGNAKGLTGTPPQVSGKYAKAESDEVAAR
ncbi:MAG TPA: hypothetical protein VEX61_11235 [Burkholderiales bacterium]|nr:hypothetical protein [Burkholderiales bacterium]